MNIPYKGPVDGLANENEPLAYPSDKNIRFCSVGTPTVIVSTPINDVSSLIFEGMELRAENHSVHDRKLQIALDLFAAYWLETSDNARLLTLILALVCVVNQFS